MKNSKVKKIEIVLEDGTLIDWIIKSEEKFVDKVSASTKVKKARILSGVTQAELARRLKTTLENVKLIENGSKKVDNLYLIKIGKALGRKIKMTIY